MLSGDGGENSKPAAWRLSSRFIGAAHRGTGGSAGTHFVAANFRLQSRLRTATLQGEESWAGKPCPEDTR